MSISASDLEYRFSTAIASTGNQLAQNDPAASLGGFLSTTIWHGGSLHDLFQLITGDQNLNREVEYRCLFVINTHATLTWQSPKAWFTVLANASAIDAIGLDPTAASPATNGVVQSVITANLVTPPVGVSFSAPTSKVSGLSLGDLLPGYCRALWFRRTANNTPAVTGDGFSVRTEGDSA